jgi:hypothetical protein
LRKLIGLAVLIVALAIPAAAWAATLSNGNSETCDGVGSYHFVNNQTDGAAAGTLTATFDTPSGTLIITVGASKVSQSNQQFDVETEGDATLVTAETNLPGRLVLSDFSCDGGKKDPPPKK